MTYYVNEPSWIKEKGSDRHVEISKQELKEAVLNSENQLALAADYAITKRIGESPIDYDTITFEEVGCFTEYFFKAFVKLKENGDARMAKVKLIVNKEKLNKGKKQCCIYFRTC